MKFLIVEPSPLPILLGPNIHLRILFSNTLSLDSSLNLRDHAAQPYSTTGTTCINLTQTVEYVCDVIITEMTQTVVKETFLYL